MIYPKKHVFLFKYLFDSSIHERSEKNDTYISKIGCSNCSLAAVAYQMVNYIYLATTDTVAYYILWESFALKHMHTYAHPWRKLLFHQRTF